jgi:hypothetical protein
MIGTADIKGRVFFARGISPGKDTPTQRGFTRLGSLNEASSLGKQGQETPVKPTYCLDPLLSHKEI